MLELKPLYVVMPLLTTWRITRKLIMSPPDISNNKVHIWWRKVILQKACQDIASIT